MNNLIIFENKQVEVFEWNGKVLFNPKHVAECLDITDVNSSIRNFNEKQLIKLKNSDMHNMHIRKLNNAGENFLTESGVYKLIFKSKKEEAEKFQDWVTDDVLPYIRKTGLYNSIGIIEQLSEQLAITDMRLRELEKIVYKKEKQRIAGKKHQLKIREPLKIRLEKITTEMMNEILINSLTRGLLRSTNEGNVVDKEILYSEACKLGIDKHAIKVKLELLNKIIYKQVRINGKNMWCIVVSK
ncbi:Bro-N domain-containing protein [Clostridium beijerinckii]|uniref:BRO-N domain-containing protein n=1 Tax=Clostridium beijerinckii TaxID=1520 RepID=UPI001F4522CC|nr:BRO family protein [Clostridium beijerinckii]